MVARPLVGSVIRDRILSSVLLPAPFRPMMPTASPCFTSNETSRRAQITSLCDVEDGSLQMGDGKPGLEDRSWELGDVPSSIFDLPSSASTPSSVFTSVNRLRLRTSRKLRKGALTHAA